jgi:hypothetical protein
MTWLLVTITRPPAALAIEEVLEELLEGRALGNLGQRRTFGALQGLVGGDVDDSVEKLLGDRRHACRPAHLRQGWNQQQRCEGRDEGRGARRGQGPPRRSRTLHPLALYRTVHDRAS